VAVNVMMVGLSPIVGKVFRVRVTVVVCGVFDAPVAVTVIGAVGGELVKPVTLIETVNEAEAPGPRLPEAPVRLTQLVLSEALQVRVPPPVFVTVTV
jgi:hypothetical protein